MDISAVLSAFITGGVTLAVCLITQAEERKRTEIKHNESIELIRYQINELAEETKKHNKVIERTYALESKTELLDEKIKVVNNRLKDLEDNERREK